MFFNEVKPLEYESQVLDPGHPLFDTEEPFNHTFPLLIMAVGSLITYFEAYERLIIKIYKKIPCWRSKYFDRLSQAIEVLDA